MDNTFAPPPGFSTGLIPRDYSAYPSGYLAAAPSAPDGWLLDEVLWPEYLRQQQADQSSLWDLREANYDVLRSLDQDGEPLCWAFSTTKATMYMRMRAHLPPVVLSPWYVAGKAVNWQSRGGWCTLSLEQVANGGAPPMSLCPSYSRRYDTTEVAAAAAKNRAVEWWDGGDDRDRNRAIMVSAFLLGLAPVLDFNHLSHSMSGCCLKSIDPLVIWCDNSWDDTSQYGPKGCYELRGPKAIPDGIVVPRVITPFAPT